MNMTLTELDDKWGWVTEGADVGRLPETLCRLEAASVDASTYGNPVFILHEIATLTAEGVIRG